MDDDDDVDDGDSCFFLVYSYSWPVMCSTFLYFVLSECFTLHGAVVAQWSRQWTFTWEVLVN